MNDPWDGDHDPGTPNGKHVPRIHITRVSDVEKTRVKWFWHSRVPSGKLSLVVGEPGGGKSFISLDLVARTTTGRPFPGTQNIPNPQGSAIVLAAEDDVSDTIRPRLEAAGADVSRVHVVEGVGEVGEKGLRTFNIERDTHLLEHALDTIADVRLVVVDPLSSYMGGDRDTWKDNEVRAALSPLVNLAKTRHIPVVGIVHLRKASSDRALHRIMGSIAFAALARAIWFVDRNPDDHEERLFVCGKLSVAKHPTGWKFALKSDLPTEPAYITWIEEIEKRADDLIAQPGGHSTRQGPQLSTAAEWLEEFLADGPKSASEVQLAAEGEGISEKTLRRAKTRLKIISANNGIGSSWTWAIPTNSLPRDAQSTRLQT